MARDVEYYDGDVRDCQARDCLHDSTTHAIDHRGLCEEHAAEQDEADAVEALLILHAAPGGTTETPVPASRLELCVARGWAVRVPTDGGARYRITVLGRSVAFDRCRMGRAS